MRLLLHVGSTKTGSSALQATLYEQREALLANGILYSKKGTAASAHHLLAAALHPNAWAMHKADLPQDRTAYFRETAAAIIEEARATGADTIVVSSEYFWYVFREAVYGELAAAFSDVAIEIVAFLRRPDHWAVSSYLQAVKNGEARSFEEWLDSMLSRRNSGIYFFPLLERWQRMVDARKVHVIIYEREVKGNVLAALCAQTGLAGAGLDVVPGQVNPSPDAEGVRRLLELNRSALPEEEKQRRRREIMRHHVLKRDREPFSVDARTRLRILKATVPSNRAIRERYVGGEGPLFKELWPRPEPGPGLKTATAWASPEPGHAAGARAAPARPPRRAD